MVAGKHSVRMFPEPVRSNTRYYKSVNGKLRDELLNGEIFTTLFEAKVLIEDWRQDYIQIRPHSALGYQPPATEVIMPQQNLGQSILTQQLVQ